MDIMFWHNFQMGNLFFSIYLEIYKSIIYAFNNIISRLILEPDFQHIIYKIIGCKMLWKHGMP